MALMANELKQIETEFCLSLLIDGANGINLQTALSQSAPCRALPHCVAGAAPPDPGSQSGARCYAYLRGALEGTPLACRAG
jgi:hypothetical protein